MTTATRVDFDTWFALYIDGDLYRDGERYMEADIIAKAAVEYDIDEFEEEFMSFETWNGVPDTLSELYDEYE